MTETAVILHRDQELVLSELQKKILHTLRKAGFKAFPYFPFFIYCTVFFKDKSMKELKAEISSVSVNSVFEENSFLYFSVLINEKICTKIKFGEIKNNGPEKETEKRYGTDAVHEIISKTELKDLPLKIRAFRLAEIERSGFQWNIKENIWCKIK